MEVLGGQLDCPSLGGSRANLRSRLPSLPYLMGILLERPTHPGGGDNWRGGGDTQEAKTQR